MQSGNKDTGRSQGRVPGGAAEQEAFTVEVTYMNWIQVAGSQLPGFITYFGSSLSASPRISE